MKKGIIRPLVNGSKYNEEEMDTVKKQRFL